MKQITIEQLKTFIDSLSDRRSYLFAKQFQNELYCGIYENKKENINYVWDNSSLYYEMVKIVCKESSNYKIRDNYFIIHTKNNSIQSVNSFHEYLNENIEKIFNIIIKQNITMQEMQSYVEGK